MKKFDGTKESLIDRSHRPLSKHPNAHTDEEIKWIKDYTRRNPHITLPELYGKLRTEKGYSRHACSLFRIIRKMNLSFDKQKHELFFDIVEDMYDFYYDYLKKNGLMNLMYSLSRMEIQVPICL